ncbi:MAG: cytochrome c [Rhodospirillaceae bacterium]|nr:cytochrome c [Rhodospirillaceae bacterium]
MSKIAKITLALAAFAIPALAKPVTYLLPEETAAFKAGPDQELVQGNCSGCHSADYILTQPRGANFGKAFWQAEVTKMIKTYGAPVAEADVGRIVDYLTKATAPAG